MLLRAVALVAPVPRPEDFGTDAFATLVQPDASRPLSDVSFLVQLKAASVSVVMDAEPHLGNTFDKAVTMSSRFVVPNSPFRSAKLEVTSCRPGRPTV